MTNLHKPSNYDKICSAIILTLMILFIIYGCGSNKKIIVQKENNQTTVLSSENATKTTEISLPVFDTVFIRIPVTRTIKPDCDSLVAIELDHALSKLNYQKNSGNNSTGIYYDKYKKLLVQFSKIGASKNEIQSKAKTQYIYITKTKIIDVPIRYIPKWVKYLAGFGALSGLYYAYKLSRIWV